MLQLNTDEEIDQTLYSLAHHLKKRLADGYKVNVSMHFEMEIKVRANNSTGERLDGFLHNIESIEDQVIKSVSFEVNKDVIL